nr:DUF4277 domain-containing protein [Candidatus Cloacimonadota bacterium]
MYKNNFKDNSMIEEAYTKQFDHLGLVAAMIDELEIVETIDKCIEQDLKQRNVS